jgi:hypothetical protein
MHDKYETINCLTEIVTIDLQRSLGGIPIQPTRSLAEAQQRYRTSLIPSQLPGGTYFLVAHNDEVALLEPIRFNIPWMAHVYWIAETKRLLPAPRDIYSDDLPIAVDQDLKRPCVHHKPPPYFSKLWRYMDDWKFQSMLEEGGLFLARADRLDDDHEGTLSFANLRYRPDVYKNDPKLAACYSRYCQELPKIKRHTYLGCWRADEKENRRSWKEYTKTAGSVAIQTTYEKLRRCTPLIFCATIEYIDFSNKWVVESNSLSPFIYKRRDDFAWEREFRIIIQQFPRTEMLWKDAAFYDCSQENPSCGRTLEVDFDYLLDQVVVAPNASDKFYREVKLLAEKYGLGKRVARSSFSDIASRGAD